jgi:hypothetical protein
MKKRSFALFLAIALSFPTVVTAQAQTILKNRLVVLSDIEADPDDSQTLIRLLLYSNQIDIEGLIAVTSVHQKTRVAPETMRKIQTGFAGFWNGGCWKRERFRRFGMDNQSP